MGLVSVVLGLKVGIKILSQINIVLCIIFLLFIFLAGPTSYILDGLVQNLGSYVQKLLSLSTSTQGYSDSSWQNAWTLYYYSWWFAWSPFVGLFIARISYGRSIQEFLIGAVLVPTFIVFVWMGFRHTSPSEKMKMSQHNTAWLNNSRKGRVAVSRSHSMFSFTQRSRHLSHQANLRCVWGSQMPALPSSWQIMFSISVPALADIWCWFYRVLTLVSAPIDQSSSTVTHQRFRTRSNISHNIEYMVRCAKLCFIWYLYLYKEVGHFR